MKTTDCPTIRPIPHPDQARVGFCSNPCSNGKGIFRCQTMFRVIQGVRKVRQTETGYENENNKKTNKIKGSVTVQDRKRLVRIAGLEPARLAALPPQSSVSAN